MERFSSGLLYLPSKESCISTCLAVPAVRGVDPIFPRRKVMRDYVMLDGHSGASSVPE
jgi:hypothetical protein